MSAPPDIEALRAPVRAGVTRSLAWRQRQLRGLRAVLVAHHEAFAGALAADLGKSPTEAHATELGLVVAEIDHALAHLAAWLAPERVAVPRWLRPARARVEHQPRGVVLVIAPWNFPLQLLLVPVVGALAAGDVVVAKPSELAPATAALLAELVPGACDPGVVTVVTGGPEVAEALVAERFDLICFTGSARVGREVLAAAARHLTPVLLELGGRNPAWVDHTVDLVATARRIVLGKFLNAGQSCVAVDHVLVERSVAPALEAALAAAVEELYGEDPSTSPDFGRIVDDHHVARLVALQGQGRVVVGGGSDPARRYVAPTVLADLPADAPVLQEEVFGPILPVVALDDLDAAIATISAQGHPLAVYAFTRSAEARRRLAAETTSGALGFGMPGGHFAVPGLPFGGVGPSGMGAYHGRASFEAFGHRRAVLDKPLHPDTLRLALYPPHRRVKRWLLRRLL